MAKAKEATAEPVVKEAVYPVKELAEAKDIIGSSEDIIMAAFKVNNITEATITEAKKIVKEFKERKVL